MTLKRAAKKFTLPDCLMSGLAVFGLKHRSLLDFDEAPCDIQLGTSLDNVEPNTLNRGFKAFFRSAQRGKFLSL